MHTDEVDSSVGTLLRERRGPRHGSEAAPGGDHSSASTLNQLTLAVAAGVCLALAFAPAELWPAAPVGVALLMLSVRGVRLRRAGALAGLAGLTFMLPLLAWTSVAGRDAWVGLAAYQALVFSLVGPLLALAWRRRAVPAWAAAAWVAQEAVRDRILFGGFPWGRLAFSQPASPFTGLAAIGGAPAVSAGVAACGALLAVACFGAWSRRRPAPAPAGSRASRRFVGAAAAGALAVGALGMAVPLPTSGVPTRVALVQGNVPRLGLDAFDQVRAVLRNHVARTEELAAAVAAGREPRPDLVLWPENSSDLDPFTDPVAASLLTEAARAIGRPILVGAVLDGSTSRTVRNSGLVWTAAGPTGQLYVKRHPVPFGEYIPLRSLLSHVTGRFQLIPYDFEAGKRPGVLQLNGRTIGDVICFEVAYDRIVRDVVNGGGRVIVVQTNNATFGRSPETRQQLAMSRLRAVEHGRTVLVVATSGISAVIAPDGRLLQRTAIFTPRVLTASVPLRSARTVADSVGEWPEALVCAAAAMLPLAAWRRRPRPA